VLGLDGAVALCETRDPPARVMQVWGVLGYALDQLPSAEDINLILIGAEITRRRLSRQRLSRQQPPVASVIYGLCDTPQEARRALKVMESYGAQVAPAMEEVSAL
jgi:hypothetical protein